MMSTGGGLPSKVEGFTHSQHTMMLFFFVTVCGHLAHDELATIDGVTVVKNFTVEMSRADGQLAS